MLYNVLFYVILLSCGLLRMPALFYDNALVVCTEDEKCSDPSCLVGRCVLGGDEIHWRLLAQYGNRGLLPKSLYE